METIKQKFLKNILYHQSLKQIINFILNKKLLHKNKIYQSFQKKVIQKTISTYSNKPFSVRVENTNFCNGQCFMCPYPTMKRKKGTMNRQLFKKIIDEAFKLDIKYINLHNFGEPLMDSDFIFKVKYAKSFGLKVSTNTNGTLLTPKLSSQIIKSKLDDLYISIDAATIKTYQKIRIGLDFKKLQNNIEHLIKLKKQLKSSTPNIIVDFLKFDFNQHEVKRFINKWQDKVDHVCISQIHDWSNKKQINTNQNIDNYVNFSQTPCRLPFTEILINWDGIVSLCCQDIENSLVLGDVKKDSISKIWTNSKYKKIRKLHLLLKTNQIPICKNCKLRTFWWSF
jgi:radical SAM protein with 4Fe4S-binding SPASM domain